MPIFTPVDIMADVVKLVVPKLSGSLVPGGTDPESLQEWLFKYGEDSNILCSSVETFIDWLENKGVPRAAYCAFMSS